MAEKTDSDNQVRLPRAAVDMKIPLPWLLGIAGLMFWVAVKLYFSVDSLTAGMDEVKASLRASNAMTSQLVSEQTLMKYRIEKLEATRNDHR
jgi:hypothetical protein